MESVQEPDVHPIQSSISKSTDPPKENLNSESLINTMTSTNPFMIPEIVAHFMSFVHSQDLKTIRLTCNDWAHLGAREIVRRTTFEFNEDMIDHDIETYHSLIKTCQKKSIQLKIKMTQFAFCRNYQKLCQIFTVHAERVHHLTFEFTEEEKDIRNEVARLKLSLLMRTHPNSTAFNLLRPGIMKMASLLLTELTHLEFEDDFWGIWSYQVHLEKYIKGYFKNLIEMVPNLTTLDIYSPNAEYIDCLIKVLASIKPVHLRHLRIRSSIPKQTWKTLVDLLEKEKSNLNLDTIWMENSTLDFARIILSNQIGKSRIIATGPRYNTSSSKDLRAKLKSAIFNYENKVSKFNRKGETFVNCIDLLGVITACLPEVK